MASEPFDHKKYAAERSAQNSRLSTELGQSAAQAVILINGGAATAILAFAKGSASSPGALASGLAGYGIGVLAGAFMIYAQNRMLDARGEFWRTFITEDECRRYKEENRSKRWFNWAYGAFGVSVFAFFAASVWLAVTLSSARTEQYFAPG